MSPDGRGREKQSKESKSQINKNLRNKTSNGLSAHHITTTSQRTLFDDGFALAEGRVHQAAGDSLQLLGAQRLQQLDISVSM
jgi:hypothetical protein